MPRQLVRVLIGLLAACLAGALTQILFAITLAEIFSLPPDVMRDRLSLVFEISWRLAVLYFLFSLPLAALVIVIGEARRIRDLTFYAFAGVILALLGFIAQYQTEGPGQTIANNYGLSAFLTAGFVAGIVYWLFSGRQAGRPLPGSDSLSDVSQAPGKS